MGAFTSFPGHIPVGFQSQVFGGPSLLCKMKGWGARRAAGIPLFVPSPSLPSRRRRGWGVCLAGAASLPLPPFSVLPLVVEAPLARFHMQL